MSRNTRRKQRIDTCTQSRPVERNTTEVMVFADIRKASVGLQLGDDSVELSGAEAFDIALALGRAAYAIGYRSDKVEATRADGGDRPN